ncbi:phage portal protein BeeE [Roseiarcus fermentans]|uniref:Phage portal protein BeeE n=1 Tax=Roseiarcus fermentans TaxID=1473586 RepID=A0A366FMJ4_9HYPH|nr:phage portal protein [Roseiarcus fermentans]RBP15904.1 phage portal protein BeeE [Roseiarcus fermentans]
MSDAVERPLTPSVFARLRAATRYAITGVAPDSWFGPQQPLAPQAPPDVKGRQFDYPFGANLDYVPRPEGGVSFAELRALADALPLLRAVIETRKDQVAAQNFSVRARRFANLPDESARIDRALAFLARPDRRRSFADWLRMLLEDLLVIDAATIYPRFDRGGALYSLDVIDGATIKPLIGDDGRAPEPPDPAYQQVLHGVPAADFSADELLYLPRNARTHRLYGMSPVEQVALTVNIALRREAATLDYYRTGSSPDAFATLPKEWTADQIRSFQDYFDALMSGNSARRRMLKFVPAEFKLIETRQPPLKDQYDEWLARVICYAFSVPATPFVAQVNRATSETMRMQATQEGLLPLKTWIKNALDSVIQGFLGEPGLEFVWVGDDAIDPLQQAQTLQILVSAGIKTREEARAELGLGGDTAGAGLGKYNQNHDERGRFSTAVDAVNPGAAEPDGKPKPKGVQIASNNTVMSDVIMGGGAAGIPSIDQRNGAGRPSRSAPRHVKVLRRPEGRGGALGWACVEGSCRKIAG